MFCRRSILSLLSSTALVGCQWINPPATAALMSVGTEGRVDEGGGECGSSSPIVLNGWLMLDDSAVRWPLSVQKSQFAAS